MPSLPPTRSTTPTPSASKGKARTNSNPVPRLKLLLLISFITLHALNLLNTLSPASAHLRWLQSPPIPDSSTSTPVIGSDVTAFENGSADGDVADEKWKDDDMEVCHLPYNSYDIFMLIYALHSRNSSKYSRTSIQLRPRRPSRSTLPSKFNTFKLRPSHPSLALS
jgi:hypothetical protein